MLLTHSLHGRSSVRSITSNFMPEFCCEFWSTAYVEETTVASGRESGHRVPPNHRASVPLSFDCQACFADCFHVQMHPFNSMLRFFSDNPGSLVLVLQTAEPASHTGICFFFCQVQANVCSLQSFLRSLSVPRDLTGIPNVKSHSRKEGRETHSNKKRWILGTIVSVYPVWDSEFISYKSEGFFFFFTQVLCSKILLNPWKMAVGMWQL